MAIWIDSFQTFVNFYKLRVSVEPCYYVNSDIDDQVLCTGHLFSTLLLLIVDHIVNECLYFQPRIWVTTHIKASKMAIWDYCNQFGAIPLNSNSRTLGLDWMITVPANSMSHEYARPSTYKAYHEIRHDSLALNDLNTTTGEVVRELTSMVQFRGSGFVELWGPISGNSIRDNAISWKCNNEVTVALLI